jgi:hypothetical protein
MSNYDLKGFGVQSLVRKTWYQYAYKPRYHYISNVTGVKQKKKSILLYHFNCVRIFVISTVFADDTKKVDFIRRFFSERLILKTGSAQLC